MIHHALWTAACARGIIQCHGRPFICWHLPGIIAISACNKGFIFYLAKTAAIGRITVLAIDNINDGKRFVGALFERFFHGSAKGRIGDQNFGIGMIQNIGNGRDIQARIKGI